VRQSSKLSAPEIANVCERGRLYALLDELLGASHLWLAAAAGSGKTCLAASYLRARSRPHLWLQLDAEDGQVATFFHYLGLAARGLASGRNLRLRPLSPEYRTDLKTFSVRYFETLFAGIPPGTLIVLDNYESVAPESELHQVLAAAMALSAEGTRWLVLSRSDVPEGLARSLADRQLQRLGWDDLRLTHEETQSLLDAHVASSRARHPAPAWLDVEYLLRVSQGWPVGVVLLMESAPRQPARQIPEASGPRSHGSHQVLFDYFAGEVFEQLSPAHQSFLLQTACLPLVDSNTARTLTGDAGAANILADLHRRNYFTFRYGGAASSKSAQVFQYHPLFRAFLRSRAAQSLAPEQLAGLRSRAADLLAETGQIEAAAELLQEAEDWARLTELALANAEALLEQGRNDTLASWIGAIPEAARMPEGKPSVAGAWLSYWWATARMPFDPGEARDLFLQSFAEFVALGTSEGFYSAWAGGVEASLFSWNDFGDLARWVGDIEPLLERHKLPSIKLEARVSATMYSAVMFLEPGSPKVALWGKRLRKFLYLTRLLNVNHYLLLANNLFHYDLWCGKMAKAKALLESLEAAARSKRTAPVPQLAWHTMKAVYGHLAGEFEYGLEAVEEGLEIARVTGVHFWDFLLLAQGAFGCLGSGAIERAEAYLARMAEVVHADRQLEIMLFHDGHAQICLQRARVKQALEHSTHAVEFSLQLGAPYSQATMCIGHVDCLVADGQLDAARPHLARGLAIAEAMASSHLLARFYLCQANLELEAGSTNACDAALARAFGLSREHEHWTFIWWRQEVMVRLCERALRSGIEVDFVSALVRRRRLAPKGSSVTSVGWPWRLQVRTLGEFSVLLDGQPLRFSRKAQRRPLELLQALIAHGGSGIAEARLAQALWPDADGDAAQQAMATTLHRLRKLLGAPAISRLDHCLSIDARVGWVDALSCDHVWSHAKAFDRAQLLGTLELYKGSFLEGSDAAWAITWRERLRVKFLRVVSDLGAELERTGQRDAAAALFERALEAEPCAEALHQALIATLQRAGRLADAVRAYQRCEHALRSAYGVAPSAHTSALLPPAALALAAAPERRPRSLRKSL